MNATVLSSADKEKGSEPGVEPEIWLQANRRSGEFAQGHVLNRLLGGPGVEKNLTPITRKSNARHHSWFETAIKSAVLQEGLVVRYVLEVDYKSKHADRSTQISLRRRLASRPAPRDEAKLEKQLEIMDYEQRTLARNFKITWAVRKPKGTTWVDAGSVQRESLATELPDELHPVGKG